VLEIAPLEPARTTHPQIADQDLVGLVADGKKLALAAVPRRPFADPRDLAQVEVPHLPDVELFMGLPTQPGQRPPSRLTYLWLCRCIQLGAASARPRHLLPVPPLVDRAVPSGVIPGEPGGAGVLGASSGFTEGAHDRSGDGVAASAIASQHNHAWIVPPPKQGKLLSASL